MQSRHYKVTFILNLRETKRDAKALTEWLKKILEELGAKVEGVEDIGIRDFVRVTHKQNPNGHYLAYTFSTPEGKGDFNTALQNRLKLENEVKRAFVESLKVEKSAKA
jgi:ribosomal protein S6